MGCGCSKTPPQVAPPEEKPGPDAEAVAASMKRALERSGTRTRRAAIAVSGPAVISKIIDMPAELGDAEIEQQIAFDAEQYIPHPKEEVNLDFQVLERDTNNPDVNRVLLVACRRDHVEARVGAMEMAGLEVCIVDIETYALQNACSRKRVSVHPRVPPTGTSRRWRRRSRKRRAVCQPWL